MSLSPGFVHSLCKILGCDSDDIEPTDTWVSLGADNLDVVEVMMELEESYDIQIDDDKFDSYLTIGDVANYVGSLVKVAKQ